MPRREVKQIHVRSRSVTRWDKCLSVQHNQFTVGHRVRCSVNNSSKGGALIDFIEFAFTTGEPLKIGEGKGDEQEPFTLEPREVRPNPGPRASDLA